MPMNRFIGVADIVLKRDSMKRVDISTIATHAYVIRAISMVESNAYDRHEVTKKHSWNTYMSGSFFPKMVTKFYPCSVTTIALTSLA